MTFSNGSLLLLNQLNTILHICKPVNTHLSIQNITNNTRYILPFLTTLLLVELKKTKPRQKFLFIRILVIFEFLIILAMSYQNYCLKSQRNLPKQFCYHGGYSRYCSCKITQADGTEVFYQVVYRAWKEKAKMRFHIESAYPLPERPGKVKKVDVWIILHNLLRNKKLPVPVDN